jgi:hypothetical protein
MPSAQLSWPKIANISPGIPSPTKANPHRMEECAVPKAIDRYSPRFAH